MKADPSMAVEGLGLDFGSHRQPLVVCYGVGRDSTAVLVGLWQRGIRPDAILFADVGAERQTTYDYLPVINAWLRSVSFPEVTIVRYQPTNFKNWPHYSSIEENVLTLSSLPAISYGFHTCSSKWKIAPQNKFLSAWTPAIEAWSRGTKVRKAIGYEDSPHEHGRAKRGCDTFAIQADEKEKYDLWFPLQEWGWNLERCIQEIQGAGLPVPTKSSCYFCCSMKPWEVDELAERDPSKLRRIVIIEARTTERHLKKAEEMGWPRGPGIPLTEGLWRRAVKGTRGGTPKPGSMTEYIRTKGLLPSAEVDALIALTPKHAFSKEDFERLGIAGWQDWIGRICADAIALSAKKEPEAA